MSNDYAFAKKLTDDYSAMGFEKTSETSLISNDGETTVEFEVELVQIGENPRNKNRVLNVYSNGTQVFSETYELAAGEEKDHNGRDVLTESQFLMYLLKTVSSELNF